MGPSQQPSGPIIVRFYDPKINAEDALGRTHEQILAWSNSQLENSHNYIQMLFPLPEGSMFNYAAPIIDLEVMKAFHARTELRDQLRRSFERMLVFYGFTTSIHPEIGEQGKENETIMASPQEQANAKSKSSDTTTMTTEIYEGNTQDMLASSAASGEVTNKNNAKASTTTEIPSAQHDAVEQNSSSQASLFSYHVVRGPNWRKASRNWCCPIDHNHLRITRILRCLRVLGLQAECDAFFAALKNAYNNRANSIGHRSMTYWTRAVQRPLHLAPDDDEVEWLKRWEAEQEQQVHRRAVLKETCKLE